MRVDGSWETQPSKEVQSMEIHRRAANSTRKTWFAIVVVGIVALAGVAIGCGAISAGGNVGEAGPRGGIFSAESGPRICSLHCGVGLVQSM